jgi:hypothetical protein
VQSGARRARKRHAVRSSAAARAGQEHRNGCKRHVPERRAGDTKDRVHSLHRSDCFLIPPCVNTKRTHSSSAARKPTNSHSLSLTVHSRDRSAARRSGSFYRHVTGVWVPGTLLCSLSRTAERGFSKWRRKGGTLKLGGWVRDQNAGRDALYSKFPGLPALHRLWVIKPVCHLYL